MGFIYDEVPRYEWRRHMGWMEDNDIEATWNMAEMDMDDILQGAEMDTVLEVRWS